MDGIPHQLAESKIWDAFIVVLLPMPYAVPVLGECGKISFDLFFCAR